MGAHEPNPLREARTGLVTLATVLGSTALMVVLSAVQWSGMRTYRVGFKITQDATGIVRGTPVILGGLRWGNVTRVEHGEFRATGSMQDAEQARLRGGSRGTVVEFALDPRIRLHPGATITRTASILGGDVAIEINDTGGMRGGRSMPGPTATPIDEGLVLAAADPADATTRLLGVKAARNVSTILDRVEEIRKAWSDRYGTRAAEEFLALRTDARGLADRLADDQPRWSERLDRTRDSMERLRRRFAADTADHEGLEADITRATTQGRDAWSAIGTDADALKRRFNEQLEPLADRVWRRARDEWNRAKKLGQRLAKAGDDSVDTYQDFMADSSLMGGQISRMFDQLMLTTLRAAIGVGVAMVDHDMVDRMQRHAAASRLVIATNDLRRANDALESLASASAEAGHDALSRDLREQATRAVSEFREAVERLVDLCGQP